MDVQPLAGALGAEITGVNLRDGLTDAAFAELLDLFHQHLVIFLPGQQLSTAEHRDFAARFGELDIPVFVPPFETPAVEGHPEIYQLSKRKATDAMNIGGFWHADVTHRSRPNLASIAYVRRAPAYGGDTLFANLYTAFQTLSPGMRLLLEQLNAVHSSAMPYGGAAVRSPSISRTHVPAADSLAFEMSNVERDHIETVHPVVRRHPATGQQCLYINRGFTSHFDGWTKEESYPLLEFLWQHTERVEFSCRYRWTEGTIGIWDNRCVLHYALNDYHAQERLLHRISVNEPSRPSR